MYFKHSLWRQSFKNLDIAKQYSHCVEISKMVDIQNDFDSEETLSLS